ncbi:MAG TPA: DHA2 family efflux MFS transporter permease subunit [Acetobacteraceae bacterium]|jgi:MFS transporter, DHA2 family, multidrug resistance protein|nr:DHA2 family efflux MFS transporter permease subunit [Acetobacteraceae bacterium]
MSGHASGYEEVVPNRTIITVCAMVATLMQALDSTIANVALPYMQGSLSASYDEITWVLTSYIVAAAIMTAPVGWLAARFGSRAIYLVSVIGFTIASMACGVATSLYEMVLFRLIQGLFGAALVPLSQGTMLNIYTAEERGWAMSVWGMGVMLGPILGPTLGGYLTELYNWRYVFFVNLPFGILCSLGLWYALPRQRPKRGVAFDWFGFWSLAIGIAGLQLMLDRGETKDWFGSTEIIIEAIMAVVGFYAFIVHMITGERTFVSPSIFKDRNLVIGFLVMFVVGMILLASTALLAPWLQLLGNYPVDVAGLLLAPRGIGTMIAMMISGRLANKVDSRWIMAFGVVLLSWSMFRLSDWTPGVNEWTLIYNTMIQGAGVGFIFVPLNVVAFATLAPDLRYEGTSFLTLVRSIGMSMGISIFEALITQNTQVEHSVLSVFASPLNRALQVAPAIMHSLSPMTRHGATMLNQMITYQAQVIAYNNDYWLMGILAIPIMAILLFMRKPSQGGGGGHAVMD